MLCHTVAHLPCRPSPTIANALLISKICRDKLVGHYPIAATDLMLNQLNLRVLLINSIGKQRLAKRRIEYKCRFTSPMIYL